MVYRGIKIGEFISNRFETIEGVDFDSEDSLYDYDLIFCDLNELGYYFPNGSYLSKLKEYMRFFRFFDKRQKELIKYAAEKKIIFFTPNKIRYSINTSNATTRIISRDNVDLLPFILQSDKNTGQRIQVNSDTIFSVFFNKYLSHFNYTSVVASTKDINIGELIYGCALCKIENTSLVVAKIVTENIYLFPNIEKDLTTSKEKEFIQDIVDVLFPISKNEKEEIPEWAKKYKLSNEVKLETKIRKLEIEKQKILDTIKKETTFLNQTIDFKRLFTGTGDDLEAQVELVFKELGFKLHPKEANRDDLIVEYNSKISVIEIKGVKKSAAESHAAQLNKWVANYHTEKGIEPKGILIVNPYKDTELTKRNFIDFFPNQMLDFSKRKEFCLISTLQLLGLYFDIKNNPTKKDVLIDSLFSTIGIYKDYQDWKQFIKPEK